MAVATEARRGVVAAGHPAVCEAAAHMLSAGGNAFDAVVAAAFAAAVAEPALTSLGGGGFLLARSTDGRATLFDFFVDNPGRDLDPRALEPHFLPVTVRFSGHEQVFNTGLGSATAPGTLRGLLRVHRSLGRIPLADVLAPAIAAARRGVELNRHQAYFLDLLTPIVTLTPPAAALFAPDGRLVVEGDRLGNPDLAAFLETLPADGDREIYEGALAERIARDMREGGGLVTEADLRAYRVVEREPLEARYRGHSLLTNPAPSFGGTLLALSLRLLAENDWERDRAGSPSHGRALLDVMQKVDRLRDEATTEARSFARGTTHVSVVDADGNTASMTTSNGEGSGYVVPGTGIMLNNMLGEDDLHPDGFHASPPGQRVASMMSPSLLVRDGRVRLVLGSGGSKRIRTALLQVLSATTDFDLPIRDAVARPRIHWDGERVHVEPGCEPETIEALSAVATVRVWDRQDIYFGGVNAVEPSGEGAGDPRRGGAARTVDPS